MLLQSEQQERREQRELYFFDVQGVLDLFCRAVLDWLGQDKLSLVGQLHCMATVILGQISLAG